MPPSAAPAANEPHTANDETNLIPSAFAGSCSAAPSSREMSAPPPTPNTLPTAMTKPRIGEANVIAARRAVSCSDPMNPALMRL
jgi:hypothetical protein